MSFPMTNGMLGKAEANVLKSMPVGQQEIYQSDNLQPLAYKAEPIAPKLMPANIDISTRRNVLPCKGITHFVLRPEPPPAAAGMVAPTGNGRHLPPGLSQEKPTNLPILKMADFFDASKFNPLGAPA